MVFFRVLLSRIDSCISSDMTTTAPQITIEGMSDSQFAESQIAESN
jgi:hypothetical protein